MRASCAEHVNYLGVSAIVLVFLCIAAAAQAQSVPSGGASPPPADAMFLRTDVAPLQPNPRTQTAWQMDLSAGFQIEPDIGGAMRGWNIQLSANPIGRRWAVVGELNGVYGRDCSYDCEPLYRDHSGLAGVRGTWLSVSRVSAFLQTLAGGVSSTHGSYCVPIGYADGRTGETCYPKSTYTYFAIQPGLGATVMLTTRLGIRTQGDMQFWFGEQGMTGFGRVLVDGVVRLKGE